MKILLTNDDGIYSKGIYAAYQELSKIAEVVVVAPIMEQSAVGHSITISDPLRIYEVSRKDKFFGYGVKGTPADCIKLAFYDILTTKPDIVVSGINHGANLASNVIYSGTVSAATEAALQGVKSFAISMASIDYTNFAAAAEFAREFSELFYKMDVNHNVVFNVNVPPLGKDEIKGWRYTVQGKSKYLDTFEKRVDPRGNTYFWLTGEKIEVNPGEYCDDYWISKGYISVTPLKYDLTDYELFNKLSERNEK
ncbi:MAG: 5'/3'-nucleotidase SurE [Calditerrivibrio sp.]|nr:5'/3'-nucleotidase SurE [Calditerrivibrio sp.]MCA1933510.1 5'/3'-nucleotidase SurE [Calditerrivibrio sp.]MCA1980285.1 5'/3'-nucleotidase SurE [Calditerrivibrio sp.]